MPAPTPRRIVVLALLPAWTAIAGGTTRAVGHTTPDLEGHLWTIWHATRGSLTRAHLLSWPDGVDLLPILGGWADIVLASMVAPLVGVPLAYNLTMAFYLLVAGVGGLAMARALRLDWPAAILCGVLLQLDPTTLQHLWAGRSEQVGVGILALFLAAGLTTTQHPGKQWPVAVALTGALSLAVAWEYALFVAAFGAWMVAIAPDHKARLRLVGGGAGAVLLAGPAVWALATHSTAGGGGRFATEWALRAAQNAVVPAVPHSWMAARPATLPLLCLLALPWTARALGRRFTIGLATGLLLALVLSLGPEPTLLHRPPTGTPASWAPFTWLASLPGLTRYQTPARLLAPWTLAAPVAAALALHHIQRHRVLLAGLVLVVSLVEVAGVLPQARHTPTDWSAMQVLADDPHPGGVYDLPAQRRGGRTIDYQQAQMVHTRGILHHSLQPYLSREAAPDDPFLAWTRGTASAADALTSLRARSFGFVVLHNVRERGFDVGLQRQRLSDLLGPPAHTGPGWWAWQVTREATP